METKERVRKVDVDNPAYSDQDVENMGLQMMKKINTIGQEVTERINKITAIYGVKAIINIQFVDQKTGQILS